MSAHIATTYSDGHTEHTVSPMFVTARGLPVHIVSKRRDVGYKLDLWISHGDFTLISWNGEDSHGDFYRNDEAVDVTKQRTELQDELLRRAKRRHAAMLRAAAFVFLAHALHPCRYPGSFESVDDIVALRARWR